MQLKIIQDCSEYTTSTAQKMKFPIKDFFSICDQICSFLYSAALQPILFKWNSSVNFRGQVFGKISEKLNWPFFLNHSLKEQYFNKFRKFVTSTCLHFYFDSLSQTFHRTDIHLSESVLQMCKNGVFSTKPKSSCCKYATVDIKGLIVPKNF